MLLQILIVCVVASVDQENLTAEEKLSQRRLTQSSELRVLNFGNPLARGIAQLGTQLFVCPDGGGRVLVYDLNTYSQTRHVTVSGLKYPKGLAACKRNNCLYISDVVSNCIHRVDLSNGSCSRLSLHADPRGVSLTRAFNLLVTLPQSIDQYTTSGSLIRSIKLDVSIDDAQHAIELSSDQFAVCNAGLTQHRVCVVDTAGRIVHSYGGPQGFSAGQLNWPLCLAVDTRGCVFVADFNNNRVQVLSPTLTRLGDVTTPGHQLNGPRALHLDEINGRLFIAGFNYVVEVDVREGVKVGDVFDASVSTIPISEEKSSIFSCEPATTDKNYKLANETFQLGSTPKQ